jgi:multidrug resistance efflux pump
MAKDVKEKTYDELAQDMCTREDSLTHLTAKAEMARRAALVSERNSKYVRISAVIATCAAIASASSAYVSYLNLRQTVVSAPTSGYPTH